MHQVASFFASKEFFCFSRQKKSERFLIQLYMEANMETWVMDLASWTCPSWLLLAYMDKGDLDSRGGGGSAPAPARRKAGNPDGNSPSPASRLSGR